MTIITPRAIIPSISRLQPLSFPSSFLVLGLIVHVMMINTIITDGFLTFVEINSSLILQTPMYLKKSTSMC